MLRAAEDRGLLTRPAPESSSMPPSVVPAATKRNRGPRSASTPSETQFGQWDPKNQRPELWNLYNARIDDGEVDPRFPALQLDRARRLAIHPPRKDLRQSRSTSRGSEMSSSAADSSSAGRPVRRRRAVRAAPGREGRARPRPLPQPRLRAVLGSRASSAATVEEIVEESDGDADLGAGNAGDRSRCRRLDGDEEARGILLTWRPRARYTDRPRLFLRQHAARISFALPLRQRRRREVDAHRPATLRHQGDLRRSAARAPEGSAPASAPGPAIDFALITEGLKAEREQGITIDVAYRYFATPQRKFIIADTPGHEQYTRNMATGASHGQPSNHPDRCSPRRPHPDASGTRSSPPSWGSRPLAHRGQQDGPRRATPQDIFERVVARLPRLRRPGSACST